MVNTFIASSGIKTLVLKPNQSMSNEQAWHFLITLFGISLVIGVTCLYWGAWMVLPFSIFECLLLAATFYWVRWQQGYREILVLTPEAVMLKSGIGKPTFSWHSMSSGFRLMIDDTRPGHRLHLYLCGSDGVLEVGRCLNTSDKKLFIENLRKFGVRVQNSGPLTCVEF